MAHAEREITINRSPEQVFNFLTDGNNNPHWRPSVMDIQKIIEGVDGIGAKYKQGLRGPGNRRMDGDYEITEFVRPLKLSFQVIAGPARPEGHYHLAPVAAGTVVRFVLDYQTKGFAKLMDPIITKTMHGEVANLTNLKNYLESQ